VAVRVPLTAAGILAGTTLLARAARGRATRRLAGRVGAAMAGLTAAAAAGYDPWLFAPRRNPVRVRPAADAAQVLGADTEVIGVRVHGEARAYPARMLARPHLLTDILGGEPIAVSYCGLTNSAIAYRTCPTEGGELVLSVLSAPRNNILYRDSRTGSFVQQLLPRVAHGPADGRPLATVPVVYTDWDTWQQLAPDTTLAESRDESPHDRVLTTLMRREHLRTRARPATLLATGPVDARLPRKTQLFGLVHDGEAVAYTRRLLQAERVLNDTAGNQPVVVLYEPWSGVAMAYHRRLDGRIPTFRPAAGTEDAGPGAVMATDDATGSGWDVLGRCRSGPLADHQLAPVTFSFDKAFWFAWAAYHPDTRLHASGDEFRSDETARATGRVRR
jgi:hypothetical protein